MTTFGKSRDLKTKTPKTQAACIFLRWENSQRVECIQMQKLTYGFIEMYVLKKLWRHKTRRHYFLGNANENKSIRQVLHLNALYPLAFVPSKKDANCLSFRSFCFQITWLTKYDHYYLKWWQPPIEETWPISNPRILREVKIWWLEVIHSNHFELFCSYGSPPPPPP